MTRDQAEAVGLQALAHVAAQDELFSGFLFVTGAQPGDLRQRALDPAFLGAVLDFILQEDARVLEFAAAAGIAPQSVAAARAALPGGQVPHWT